MTKFGVGQPVARVEDPRLITGRGRYTDDIALPDQAHAHVLRSPHAHARLSGVDTSAARAAPGVLAVLTGEDVAQDGLGDIPCLVPMKNRDGTPRADTPRPLLAKDRVRHVGDPVALVVALSLAAARDAAELIEVDYEPLPVAVGTVEATRDGAPRVWDHAPNNLAFDFEVGDPAAVAEAFATAAHVVEVELVNNRVVCNAMEPRSAVGHFDPETGRTTLHVGCQGTHLIRDQFAEKILKQPKDKVRVLCGDVGGGFGMKAFFFPEYGLVAWASRRLGGRPVKWTSERTEAFMSDGQGRDNVTIAELALDADARFLALRATTYANMGAYLSNFAPMIPTGSAPRMLTGLYRIPVACADIKGVLTNSVPVDAYRGAGRPEAAYVIERLVDVAAMRLNLSPDEIRRRNFVPRDGFPYTTAFGDVYDDGDFAGCMDECMARADWAGFEVRRRGTAARGRLRGISMATYVEVCGGGSPETAQVVVEDGRVTILIGTQTNGQGHATAYAQLLAERLGVDAGAIELVQGDSDRTAWGLTGGSRSVPVGGAAILGAADGIIDKAKRIAAHALETAVQDIAFADGRFTVVGTDRGLSLFEVARAAKDPANLPEGIAPGLDETHKRVPEAPTYPNGCHICEVEVDPETGRIEIVRYTVVDDFGAVINPLLLAGQVHGGIVQGVGQALLEETVYDPESGQLLSGSLMDYTLPRADDLILFDFSMRNVPCRTNPLGIKGAGEAGSVGAAPAVINAVVNALRPATGIEHIDMPATPLRVWRILQQRRAA